MKEKKFDENVEKIYTTLSDEQKADYIAKVNKNNIVMIIFEIILVILPIFLLIAGIIENINALLIVGAVFTVLSILIAQWAFRNSLRELKASDDIKVKTRIRSLELQKQWKQEEEQKKICAELQKNVHYRLQTEKIKSVTILDSYTEISDKLHAVLNYQEIIQTRMYKFRVEYIDGTSTIITAAENSREYNTLMPFVGKETEHPTMQTTASNIEKLREYKRLLDDGIITQEEFEAKKKEFLQN